MAFPRSRCAPLGAARTRRALRCELLERRELLAGDTYLVNFQLDEATPPTNYLVDEGLVFGNRGDGLFYGWSTDHTDQARERSAVPDQRFDTLIHFEAGQFWEFAVPAGAYEVTVGVGDPSNNDGLHTINVEGVSLFNAVPDGNGPQVRTVTVNVTDGRLRLDQGAAAHKATRINFVHIVGLAAEGNSPPVPPTITEPAEDGQLVNPNDVHMEAVGYVEPDGDAHKSTDWEIWTIGANPVPVWQTLGIQGVERLHTHLGDGIFLNDLAGRTALAGSAEYELRVRFRDDAGAVSAYATRTFLTTDASATAPLEITGIDATAAVQWQDAFGAPVELPSGVGLLAPGDPILAVDADGGSDYPANESPANAIDGTLAKYLNFGEINAGFIVTPSSGPSVVTSFQITTANDAEERDPVSWRLFGTNAPIASGDNSTGNGEAWSLIANGNVSLPAARNTQAAPVAFSNSTSYASYKFIFNGVKNATAANSVQIGEIQFFGDQGAAQQAAVLRLEAGASGDPLLQVSGNSAPGNEVERFPDQAEHVAVRMVLEAGVQTLNLRQSDFTFTDAVGAQHIVYLPAVQLGAGQRADFWVGSDGSTYYGNATQTTPNFDDLARSAAQDVPFVATRPGFVVEQVGDGYRLPVNIAFVPDPGPDPDDPLYFVTELYGSIQVVTRDGSKHEFATGLLDYNPQGPISGSGEQGLAGIVVERSAADPDVYQLYVTMLWDNGAPPGSAVHYPKVERLDSVPGGLSMAARTVLLNMQPETQGQSHQISNITIGPDDKLYVHNGDGFDASTARNLNSFRGKVLRLNKDGSAPSDNPFYNDRDGISARDYVFAYGVRNPFGGAWRAADGAHYSVENGPSVDRMNRIERGVDYGWNGSNNSMFVNAIYNWVPATAPVNIAFVQRETFAGSQFPAELMDRAFVSESGPTYAPGPQAQGKRIVEFQLGLAGNRVTGPTPLVEYVGTGRGTIVGLSAGPDGLYFTELYEDSGENGPTASGARIFRVRYANAHPGDHNVDEAIDGADLLAWQRSFGSNLLLGADNNRDGLVDEGDLPDWEMHFGMAHAATADVVAVSETAAHADATEVALPTPQLPASADGGPLTSRVQQLDPAHFDQALEQRQQGQRRWGAADVGTTRAQSSNATQQYQLSDGRRPQQGGVAAFESAFESAFDEA